MMGKYIVKFACGHEETVELFGKISEREKRIEWYEKNCKCSECNKKAFADKMCETHDIVEMHYAEYKKNYADCKTVKDSYNRETKTIKVYVEKNETKEEKELAKTTLEQITKELTNELKNAISEELIKENNTTFDEIKDGFFTLLEEHGHVEIKNINEEQSQKINRLANMYYKKAKEAKWI